MNRKSFQQCLSLLSLMTVALLTLQAQPVTLQYAPQDGQIFEVVERFTRVPEAAPDEVHVRERTSRVEVAAYSAPDPNATTTTPDSTAEAVPASTAFSNKVTIVSQSLMRGENVIVSPVHAALPKLELTYHLDANGKLLRIDGYESLGQAMAASLPDKLADTLVKLVNPDTLRYQDTASYQEIYGLFTDGSITPVVNAVSAASHALPLGGSLPLYEVLNISPDPEDPTGKIRVTRRFNSDAAALAEATVGLDEAAILATKGTLPAMPAETYASASVEGSELVIVQVSGVLVESRVWALQTEWTLPTPDDAPDDATPKTHRIEEGTRFTVTPVEVPDDATADTQP